MAPLLQIAEIILFLIAIGASFYIPGKLFLKWIKINNSFSLVESTTISCIVGIALFLLGTYVSAYAKLPYLYLVLDTAAALYWIYTALTRKHSVKVHLKEVDWWSTILLLGGSIAVASLMYLSGLQTTNGLQFINVNGVDGIRHIAYITDQINHFPHRNPVLQE